MVQFPFSTPSFSAFNREPYREIEIAKKNNSETTNHQSLEEAKSNRFGDYKAPTGHFSCIHTESNTKIHLISLSIISLAFIQCFCFSPGLNPRAMSYLRLLSQAGHPLYNNDPTLLYQDSCLHPPLLFFFSQEETTTPPQCFYSHPSKQDHFLESLAVNSSSKTQSK